MPCKRNHTRENSWWINDGYGIPLCRVCDECEDEAMQQFRPDIMEHYEADEPIEADW